MRFMANFRPIYSYFTYLVARKINKMLIYFIPGRGVGKSIFCTSLCCIRLNLHHFFLEGRYEQEIIDVDGLYCHQQSVVM